MAHNEYDPRNNWKIEVDNRFNQIYHLAKDLLDKTKGPRPLTIQQYRDRIKKPTPAAPVNLSKKKSRGGKAVRIRKERAELHRIIPITSNPELKKQLILDLQKLAYNGAKTNEATDGRSYCKQQ
jgi:hypothetical protein